MLEPVDRVGFSLLDDIVREGARRVPTAALAVGDFARPPAAAI
jgi:hypothetical protein